MPAARPVAERVAAIDQKIAKKKAELEALEQQKNRPLHPVSMRTILTKAKEAGMTPEEIAEKLGIEVYARKCRSHQSM